MRRKVWLAILLLTMSGLVAQADVTTTVVSSADTYLNSTTTTHGSETFMYIFDGTGSIMGYERFDLSSLPIGTIVSATLKMTVSGGTGLRNDSVVTGRYGLHGLNNIAGNTPQNWDEATLNRSNTGAEVNWTNGTIVMSNVTNLDSDDSTGTTETIVNGTGGSYARGTTITTTGAPFVNFLQSRAEDNGLVTFIVRQDAGGARGYGLVTKEEATDLDYRPVLTLTYLPGAGHPQPANGAVLLRGSISQLSWTLYNDPSIYKCDVYLGLVPAGTEPNILTMDKLTFDPAVESVNINDFASYDTPLPQGTYYWRVDSYNDPNQTATEPNFVGRFWNFTATELPVFTQHPAEQIKFVGETADFTIAVTSSTLPSYTWYRSPDNVNNTPGDDIAVGTNSTTLTLPGLTATNEGYYYCKATNTGGSAYSNTANLGVKRKVSYWTLDGLVGGQYADSSGEGHPADPNGTPVFVDGANPAASGNGVQIDAANGYASSGAWNPSEHTRQFSFSLWTKWAGQTTPISWQGLIAKENAFGAATMMWQLEVDQGNNNLALKSGNSTVTSTPLPVDTWIHVVVTYDGTTARIYRNTVSDVNGAFVLGTKTDAPMIIGASSKAADTGIFYSLFNGVLDDIHVYNYPLTQTEIIDLYHAVSGLSICTNRPTYDISGDCLVTLADFAMVATNWLQCGMYPLCP